MAIQDGVADVEFRAKLHVVTESAFLTGPCRFGRVERRLVDYERLI